MDQEQFLDVSDNVVLDLADADNQREREVAKKRKDYNQARFESLLKSEQLKMRKREMEERRRAIWEEEDENSKEAIKISKTPLTFGQKAEYRFHPSRDPRVQIAKAKEATEQKKIQLAADVEQWKIEREEYKVNKGKTLLSGMHVVNDEIKRQEAGHVYHPLARNWAPNRKGGHHLVRGQNAAIEDPNNINPDPTKGYTATVSVGGADDLGYNDRPRLYDKRPPTLEQLNKFQKRRALNQT